MIYERYINAYLLDDLKEKMVFVGGPRQVGKTSVALSFAPSQSRTYPGYLNWDELTQRNRILKHELPLQESLLIFDEIHKYVRWRQLMKGLFDVRTEDQKFIVTGSARLDYYRKGGDSLQGRYHYWRLHPYSVNELNTPDALTLLLKFGGFPEPILKQSERHWRRWQLERQSRILNEDLHDLERVREVSQIELLLSLLPRKVASPLSIKSLKEELSVAHESVERWITILENLYVCFRICPFTSGTKTRTVKKEKKLYFWDWSLVSEEGGARFENLVASQLLKYCHFEEDKEGYRMELCFLRDFDKREVDFVVLKNKKPIFAVECKTGEKQLSPHIHYFAERTKIPLFFQVHKGQKDYAIPQSRARVMPFEAFCKELKMP